MVQEAVAPTAADNVEKSALAVDLDQTSPPLPVESVRAAALLAATAGLGFTMLMVWIVRQGAALPILDDSLHRWVLVHRGQSDLAIARAVTWGGATQVVLPALVVVGALSGQGGRGLLRRLQTGLLATIVACVGVYAGLRINAWVGRARPPIADWAGAAGGAAFPSGHTTAATLFATCCVWVVAARVRPRWLRRAMWVAALIWAAAVGWSRIWLGVHWPTDVLGGWLFALTWFVGSTAVIRFLRTCANHRKSPRSPGSLRALRLRSLATRFLSRSRFAFRRRPMRLRLRPSRPFP